MPKSSLDLLIETAPCIPLLVYAVLVKLLPYLPLSPQLGSDFGPLTLIIACISLESVVADANSLCKILI